MGVRLVQFQTEEGEILIEVPTPPGMVAPVGRLEDSVEAVGKTLDQALRSVAGMSRNFRKVFNEAEADSGELELGLQFTATGSVYVVETSGEASLKIKLSFTRNGGGSSS